YMIQLLIISLKLPKLDWLIGLSCPSNDMPLYLLRLLIKKSVVQIIHGPVPSARSSGYCLVKASAIFYLASTKESLLKALQAYLKVSPSAAERYWAMLETSTFTNGLSPEKWPKQANTISKRVFWAASLFKWKNLDLLIEAISLEVDSKIEATVCYLKPTVETASEPDFSIKQIEWHEDPSNLNQLRAQCGIFVSTSINEPFGLSILEALAAGMCVVVPCDDSYWDRVLTHGKNCIKYTPNDVVSLHNAIHLLNEAPWLKVTMGIEALSIAQLYTAERCYFLIVDYLHSNRSEVDKADINSVDKIKGYDHV
ncbi:glycosyltransferase, partial [Vibrio agarivorans]